MGFVHLHLHTEYSLLDSTVKIRELVKRTADFNMEAVAITDKDVMHGVIPFYKECMKENIKPIIGLELWVNGLESEETYPVILLSENNKGYMSLVKLSSVKQTEGFIHFDKVRAELTNCIVILPYADSEPSTLIRLGETEKALSVIKEWKGAVKGEKLFLERQPVNGEESTFNAWKWAASESQIKLIAGNNVHMNNRKENKALLTMRAIREGKTLKEIEEHNFHYDGCFLNEDEIAKQLPGEDETITLTKQVADRCHVVIDLNQTHMPEYPLPKGKDARTVLYTWSNEGLSKRYENVSDEVKKRLNDELEIIDNMGFNDYFLIVADFVKYARSKGILVGPGRGSAAGSLVAYALEITDIDPIKHNLLFERFLNPERTSLPDIDIDFPDYRRDEVIEYVREKYGSERVARIVTFGTFGARAAIRDVGRVLDTPQALIDRIVSLLPHEQDILLQKAYESEKSLQALAAREPLVTTLLKLAAAIEGMPRHTSVHAAGVVISAGPLTEHVPLMRKNEEILLTQYPMDILENIGLIKMDFLGLKNLSLIEHIVTSIYQQEGIRINVRDLPVDDEETFKSLSKGDTTGIFQLESPGMRRALRQIRPTVFEDISAVNALYRPGPMESISTYARRKHGDEQPFYSHDSLKPILSPTYGVIIYQEQIMQIAAVMAGYSYGEADLFRRAVSKKDRSVLEEERHRFIEKSRFQGYTDETASSVYDLIIRFANYGFNRSHAVAYSYIAYQLAYLKTHFPAHFYAALLTMNQNNNEKLKSYIREAANKGLTIKPPSINNSRAGFTVDGHLVYFGFLAIKYVNGKLAHTIITERKNARFQNFIDFLQRVYTGKADRKAFESLIKAGAFDELESNRAMLLSSLDQAMEFVEFQKDLGGLIPGSEESFRYVYTEPFSEQESYEVEKEVTGHYLSGHPLDRFHAILTPFNPIALEGPLPDRQRFWTAGIVESVKAVRTKNGEAMSFLFLTDGTGEVEIVVFPSVHRRVHSFLSEQTAMLIKGRKDYKSSNKILADHVLPLEELDKQKQYTLFLKIDANLDQKKYVDKVKQVLIKYPGSTRVLLYYEKYNETIQLSEHFRTFASPVCLRELRQILSEKSVVLKQ